MQWNARLYDKSHDFVSRYGEDVVELLDAAVGEQILDLGCGTGDLTQRISLAGCSVTGVDASARMIAAAQEKYPRLHFVCADAASLDLPERFDAVFSNAALHWMREPDQVLDRVAAHLKRGGRFVAEMGARGNVQKITDAIAKVLRSHGYEKRAGVESWYFPSPAEYAARLESHGFGVRFMACFDRPTPLSTDNGMAAWLNMLAGNYFAGMEAQQKAALLDEIVEELAGELYRDGSWVADYRRLRFQAVLEG
jgi:trans-aconitate methyltransferase